MPPQVKAAFDEWYDKLALPPGITVRFVGSAPTEEKVDRALGRIREFAEVWHSEFEIIELDSEKGQALVKQDKVISTLQHHEWKTVGKAFGSLQGIAEIEGTERTARIKGLILKSDLGVEMLVVFAYYGFTFVTAGSVRLGFSQFEARERVFHVLDIMEREGVELDSKEVWVDEARKVNEWKVGGGGYDTQAAARGENPYYPGLPAAPEGGYTFPNPTGIWKADARDWLNSHPKAKHSVTPDEIESLYRAGATNIFIGFEPGSHCTVELAPPNEIKARREVVRMMKAIATRTGSINHWDDGGEDYAKLLDEMAEDPSEKGPWMIY